MSSEDGTAGDWWEQLYRGGPDAGPPEGETGSLEDWFASASEVVVGEGEERAAGEHAAGEHAARAYAVREDERETLTLRQRAGGEPVTEPGGEPVAPPRIPPLPGPRRPVPGGGPAAEAVVAWLPEADPERLGELVPDTVLEAAGYGELTLRGASVRGEGARRTGEPRRDHLLVARFGDGAEALLLAVLASGTDKAVGPEGGSPEEACRRLAVAVGHGRDELLADLRAGAQERLHFGLQRLTAAAGRRLPGGPGAGLHGLLVPGDGAVRPRVGFGVGPGGCLLLDGDEWFDAYAGVRLREAAGSGTGAGPGPGPSVEGFRFRVAAPERGDVLLLCSAGFAEPVAREVAVSRFLAERWGGVRVPDAGDFLRHVQVPARGYLRDRTAVALWEG